jgi:hypothetical protein
MLLNKTKNIKSLSLPQKSSSQEEKKIERLLRTNRELKLKLKKLELKQKTSTKGQNKKTNEWFPNLGDTDFGRTFCFVLQSIYKPVLFVKEDKHFEFYTECLQQIQDHYLHLIKHHGVTQGSKKFKDKVQFITLLAEGRNPEPLSFVSTIPVSLGKYPIPTAFSKLLPLVEVIAGRGVDWHKAYQALITILALPRLSKEIPELDIISIIADRKSSDKVYLPLVEKFRSFVKQKFSRNFRTDFDPKTTPFDYVPRMRMTSGPNREVTLGSAVAEAQAIMQDKTLSTALECYLSHTGGESLLSYMKQLAETPLVSEEVLLGRITQVPDSLNKNRVVAMVDYWTNLALAPLEEIVRYILKENFTENDYLRNHSLGCEKVRDFRGKS